jgi:hypothetical protein
MLITDLFNFRYCFPTTGQNQEKKWGMRGKDGMKTGGAKR